MNKPSGAECNIDCDYCFYLHKTDLLKHDDHARMSDSFLEQHIRQYIEAQTGEQVVFSWQGGEPTLPVRGQIFLVLVTWESQVAVNIKEDLIGT